MRWGGGAAALALAAGLAAALNAGALPKPFPTAAARTYLAASKPPVPSLAGTPRAAAPATVRAAERELRDLADTAATTAVGQRQRALAAFALGVGEGNQGNWPAAQADLAQAATYAPLRDAATAALVAGLDHATGPPDAAAAMLVAAAGRYPVARTDVFYAQIALPAARAAATLRQWPQVLDWTTGIAATAPVVWLRAQAEAGTGDARAAALLDRDLLFRFPASAQAALATPRWRQDLAAFPDLAPDWRLTRTQAGAWTATGRPRDAAASWAAAAELAPAAERPALQAFEARAWMAAGDVAAARTLIAGLLTGPERPQAMEIQVELARSQKSLAALQPLVASLAAEFPASAWYARALHETGDEALIDADAAGVEANFDALVAAFPESSYAPGAAWQAAWAAYRLGQADTPQRFDRYLTRYPRGAEAVDALYWRGAWAASHHQPLLARACFRAAARRFPGTYFGLQAAGRATATRAAALADPPSWLLPFTRPEPTPVAGPLPAAFAPELERAGWLRTAGLLDPAATIMEGVLRAQAAGAPSLAVARQLAPLEAERAAWHSGLAAMIRAVPHYLELAPRQLPQRDWKLLFPLPYPAEVALVARHDGLDRDLLLGIMRQESGFNASSVSGARARGLMQLELATARGHLPQLPPSWRALAGPGPLAAQDLLNPGLNIALGAAELRGLLARYHGTAYALAGYNAGASRTRLWLQNYPGLDVNAFIESIPFGQTRDYVQAVLRNRAHYAQIYGR